MQNNFKFDTIINKGYSQLLRRLDMGCKDLVVDSIVASFHRACGLKSQGISMSLDIINRIRDDTSSLIEKNILVWNLYMLSKEFIDDKEYDIALKFIERMDNNWSRDLILWDKIGFYHVSWREQLWIRRAEVYMCTNKVEEFNKIVAKIIKSRLDFFNEAVSITGETIIGDRCIYSTYKLMAYLRKKLNEMDEAVDSMKKALYYKGCMPNMAWQDYNGRTADELQDNKQKLYEIYFQMYYRLPNNSFDNIHYGYCASCTNLMENGKKCRLHNITVDSHKACSQFRH